MFERFTERARQVVVLAQEEARNVPHNYIGTEHILLGLMREEEGLAARALERLGVTVEGTREEILRIVGPTDPVDGQIPFTPRAKRVLELALREALSLGHNYIGTEHVLLGLIREEEGIAIRILRDKYELDGTKIRNMVIELLSGPRYSRQVSREQAVERHGSELGAARYRLQRLGGEIQMLSEILQHMEEEAKAQDDSARRPLTARIMLDLTTEQLDELRRRTDNALSHHGRMASPLSPERVRSKVAIEYVEQALQEGLPYIVIMVDSL